MNAIEERALMDSVVTIVNNQSNMVENMGKMILLLQLQDVRIKKLEEPVYVPWNKVNSRGRDRT